MSKKKTTEEFRQEVFNLVDNEYSVLDEYINTNTKILMRHNICNYEYEVRPADFLRKTSVDKNGKKRDGCRCPKCAGKIKNKDTIFFKQEIYNLVQDEYEVLGEYKNSRTKILMRHNICNYEYYVKPNDFQQGYRCPKCYGNNKKTTEEFESEVFTLVKDEYSVLGEYKNNKEKILMRHNICNKEFEITPHNFLRGTRCPYCQRSKGEEFIENYLKEHNIPYETQVSFEDCRNIRKLKFDFKIYNKDKTKFILLEYNGRQHYEQTGFQYKNDFQKGLKRDKIKQKYCYNKGLILEIIRYDEDIEKRLKDILL